jgi:ATP-dependent DNA ligase
MELTGPVWLMQPIPYFGEELVFAEWLFEPKIDGWRLQIIKYPNGKIEFWGRRLEKQPNWTEKLAYLTKYLEKLAKGTLLDSELYTNEGRNRIPSLFTKNFTCQPIIYVFDIIFYQNKFVGDLPLKERKELLKTLPLEKPFFLILGKELKDIKLAYEEAIKAGNEGIIIKKLSSPYQLSPDGPIATENWRKIK